MQKCNNCNATWTFSKILEKCPFCGETIIDRNRINSIEDALKIVFREHGISVLRESGRLLGLLGDYAPSLSKERGLIKLAVESGAYAALFDAIGLSEAGRQQVINRYVEVMEERFYVAENWARQSITWCINALDLTDDRNDELVHDQAVDVKKQQADATSQFSPIISTAKNKEPTPKLEMPKDAVVSNGVLKKYNGSLDVVQFPSGIIEIGAQAFYGNERIRRIVLPNTV